MRTAMVAPALAVLVTLTGCGSTTDGAAVADHSCAETSVPLTDIETQSDREPQLRIPQPPGWDTTDDMNSAMIRFAMVNRDLTTDGFAPNAVVTFETAGGESGEADEVFGEQRDLLESQLGVTDVSVESGLQCGYPAQTISYTAPELGDVPERRAKVLCVLADTGGKTYLATVTVSSLDPEDPTYAIDAEAILTGFQINASD